MAITDTLRAFATAVVGRNSEQDIENAIQALITDLHALGGSTVQKTVTTTVVETVPADPVTPAQ